MAGFSGEPEACTLDFFGQEALFTSWVTENVLRKSTTPHVVLWKPPAAEVIKNGIIVSVNKSPSAYLAGPLP